MKKRTSLVCFLIFTLCVFYISIPNTVFGQEEDTSLAAQVIENHGETLQREDLQEVLIGLLVALRDPELLQNPTVVGLGGVDGLLDFALASPALVLGNPQLGLDAASVEIYIEIVETDEKVRALLMDADFRTVLKDPDPAGVNAIKTFAAAGGTTDGGTTDDGTTDDGTTDDGTTDDGTTDLGQEEASLAAEVIENHGETLQREDLQEVLIGLLVALRDPELLQNPTVVGLGGVDGLLDFALASPALVLGNPQLGLDAASVEIYIEIVETDEKVRALLMDADFRTVLKDPDPAGVNAIKTFAAAGGTTDGGTTDDGTTDDGTTDDGTTDDGTTDDGTTDDGTITPPPPPPPPGEQANPFDPIMPTNESLSGESRLGGLSINRISGRKFLADLVMRATGLPIEALATLSGQTQYELVEMIVQLIPKEVPLTKKQIRQILKSDNIPIFAGKLGEQDLAQGLDAENFGNAITPMPIELLYDDRMGDQTDPNRKYLTHNSLNLYVRVPSVNVGGVKFSSSDGTLQKEGQRVSDPAILGSETIPYTFRLEEALAATNLPAWPALENNLEQLFDEVTLRYSSGGLHGRYTGYSMHPTFTENGVVWETEEIDVTQGNSFYYFDVVLATSVTLEVLDREKLAELAKGAAEGNLPSISDVLNATLDPPLEIKMWSMPDPRNLQLADRGILEALFDSNFRAALTNAAGPLLAKLRNGESPTQQEILNAFGKHRVKLQNILLRNSNKVTTQFESGFDPMLSSVFSIPKVDLESESLWVASFDDIQDGNYFVGAVVHDEDGNPLDQMWSDVTVDTEAPEADVEISEGDNTVVYKNADGVYVATNLEPGTATLKVTGIPGAGRSNYVAQGEGYLLYQILGLNPDGTPDQGDSSLQRPNTWMPLTPEATMLASTVWDQTIEQLVRQGVLPEELDLSTAGLGVMPTENLTLDLVNSVLPILATPLGLGIIENDPTLGPTIKQLGDFLGEDLLDPKVINLLVEVFGATVELINHIPITYGDPNNDVMMLAQLGEDVFAGDYGIRAMGIDNLFNVSSHTAPTRLKIVDRNDPAQMNRASVVLASIGDRNGDGMVDARYEHGTIYANTTQGVELTIKIDQHPHFLASIVVEYQDANGSWQPIPTGALSADELAGTQVGAEFSVMWDVTDFDALIGAGDSVMVRAVATNALQIADDAEPVEFPIELDAGVYPPEVLSLEVDDASIMSRNPDSDAPQGTVTINASTLPLTGPRTVSVRFEATQGDGVPIPLGIATQSGDAGLVDAVEEAVNIAASGTDAPINSDNLIWSITVDTTTLEDTITKESPGARDASLDDNQYTIRAFAVSMDGTEWPSDAMTTLSVDNVDDVEPLGPTNITAIANADGAVEVNPDGSYNIGGLIDAHDLSVVLPIAKFTIEPTAERKTYKSVMLVTVPEINAEVIGDPVEITEGVFEIKVDAGALGIAGNGAYTLHALAFDQVEPEPNIQTDASPERTVHVKNYLRPDPAVFKIAVDVGTEKNADSEGPQGTFMFTGYTIEQNSPPIMSIRLESKRANDTDWTTIGTGDASTSIDIEDAALPGVLDYLAGIAVEGTETGDKSVVAIDATNKQWAVSVDTVVLKLADTITAESPGARDVSKDDNLYTVRAFAVDGSGKEWPSDATVMFSLDNVDDVAPLDPTSVSVTSVDGVDVVFEASEDGNSFTVGGLVDKYDDAVASPVATVTIEPIAERKTYKSVKFTTDAEGVLIGEITETAEGSGVFTVTVDVGTLADGETYLENGTYVFQALAYDEFDNVEAETDDSKISGTVENSYRPAPEVLAIAVDPESITQTNPDSGAPQGTITLHSYSHEISSPPTTAVRFEVKRPSDAEWIDVGTATESSATEISDATLTDVVDDLAHVAVSATEAAEGAEGTVVPISRNQMWTIEVDTTTLEDTITAESPAARDASKDDNQYMVRAVAIAEADGSETLSADGVTAMFSVDNVDDVAPLGPTNIVAVADVAGMIAANEDGSYTVGGIVDPTVPTPIAIFTTEPTADPITYASVNLVQTAEDAPETTTEGEAGALDITIDVGLLENGTYMFHALAVDEFGNVQTDESPMITVHVLNFRVSDVTDLAVIAVDGTDVPEPPAEPIPLRESVTVSFMVANDLLAAEELSGAVNGDAVPSESAEDPENTFSIKVEVGALVDGVYIPDGVVTKRNGSVAFPLTTVNVDNTGPMVTIESPTEDETVDSLPTLRATYHDGAGSGVDGATGSLALARLQPNEVEVVVDQAELEKDAASLVYTRREELAGGAYRVTVQVTDNLGNVGEGSAEFAVNGTAPMVAIHSPAAGQTFEHGEPLISGEFSGTGTVEVTTFTINDVDATPEVDGNQFSYTPEEALVNGDYKVVVAVTDGDGNTARTSVVFMVDIPEPPKDTTPPVISSVAPTGLIKGADREALGSTRASAVVTDEQSAISAVEFSINGQLIRVSRLNIAEGIIEAPIDFVTHGPGLYTVRLKATSEGGTTEHVWTFTFAIDDVKPTITSITPSGTFRGGLPVISASASDESGIDKMTITVMDSKGKEVKGKTGDDGEDTAKGISRLDFNPDVPLEEGTYTIAVRATDTLGNSATAKGNFTIDFDTAAPIITMASPQNNARLTYAKGEARRPTISISYADAETGINVESIRFIFNDKLTNLTSEQKSASQVTYIPPEDLDPGQYSVKLEVFDRANEEGNVSDKSKGAREANMAVYEFTFSVEEKDGPILAARPLNYPNPFKDKTRISFSLARQATVSIVIYDATLRPVRVLVDNRVFDAGNYTRKDNGSDAVGWDGTSSSGEDLARGIYFCEIIVADGFEPEYAILKLALTR